MTPPPLVFTPSVPGACVNTQWPVEPRAVLIPADVVIESAGHRIVHALAEDAGDERADVGRVRHVALKANDVVGGRRLDQHFVPIDASGVHDRRIDVRVLASGGRRQRAIRPLRSLAGHLGGAEDGRLIRPID